MKRIGTITAAVGLIYYGIWLALRNINPLIAENMFKWWPVLFILLGVEILVFSAILTEQRKGFNGGIIFVILLFLVTNIFYGVPSGIRNAMDHFNNNWDFSFDSDFNENRIDATKTISIPNKKFEFDTQNGDIQIKKSEDGNVKAELTVYVDDNSNIKNYDIKENQNSDTAVVDINESYVKKVSGTLYIPDGTDFKMDVNNLKIDSNDDLKNTNFDIQSNNGKYDIDSAAKLNLDFSNGAVNLKDINTVTLKGNNASFKLNGDVQNIDIQSGNGAIDINNNTCGNVNIKSGNSSVKLDTQDKNIDADLSIGMGECRFNDEKITKGELKKTVGDGSHKVIISANLGSVRVSSQE